MQIALFSFTAPGIFFGGLDDYGSCNNLPESRVDDKFICGACSQEHGINENAVQAVVSQAFCSKSSKIPLIILGEEFAWFRFLLRFASVSSLFSCCTANFSRISNFLMACVGDEGVFCCPFVWPT